MGAFGAVKVFERLGGAYTEAGVVGGTSSGVSLGEPTPNEQNNDSAYHGTEKTCSLIYSIKAEGLSEVCRDNRSRNSQKGSEDEATGFVWTGVKPFCD